ncbi:MAG: hydantoinase/oxoprolinase family protein [Syntrophorhabdales bacterium]|jgi:N-methylhydantoinase A/acetophenone carboxylase
MFTIDIDTGGTFTDGFFTREGEFKTAKVLTTPHDLTVCLSDCIKEGAKLFGVSSRDMLANTDIVRYSTTTGVNALITRTGSKIGLIVSKGYKDSLYSPDEKDAEPVFSFIPKDLIEEVGEVIDDGGNIVTPLDRGEVLGAMQRLIDTGARAIAVSLRNSHINPVHEKKLKGIIKEQYPNFYLGSVRVFLASEISDQPNDFYRTNTVVVNGYIHDVMVKYLYKAEDDLRANFCAHPLMVAHSHGGVARVAKTRAIDTYSSGPALGVIGAGNLGGTYGFPNVITVDIGGTSLDLGIIREGAYTYSTNPLIAGFPVSVPVITTYSAAIASGSIAGVDASKTLRVGPKSAGARPGPACFDLGGMEPTVTDADVILGFIDPNYFLGGRIKLNKSKAEQVMKMRIADRLGVSVQEAAWMVREEMGKMTAGEILRFAESYGIGPQDLSGFAVVVYGGAGPTHYGDFVRDLSFGHSIATPYASVFSAFGSSTTDLLHSYSKFVRIELTDGKAYFSDYDRFNEIVAGLTEAARRDIRGEGFSPDKAGYSLELTGDASVRGAKIVSDMIAFRSQEDVRGLCGKFAANGGPVSLSAVVLNARVPMPHLAAQAFGMAGEDPAKAMKPTRQVFWSPEAGFRDTPVFDRELLAPGNAVVGPAIVEAKDTTYVIPAGMSLKVDEYSNAIMMKG